MVNVALLVRLEAKPGKENEVESFLKSGLAIVEEEPDTIAWFAIRMRPLLFNKNNGLEHAPLEEVVEAAGHFRIANDYDLYLSLFSPPETTRAANGQGSVDLTRMDF